MKTQAKRINYRKRSRLIFYTLGMLLPLLQFCVFYIYTNLNSFILAFSSYEARIGAIGYDVKFAGFSNFLAAFKTIGNNMQMIENSLILFVFSTLLGLTLASFFSFYIYKKYAGSGFFRVILFLPQIVSQVVFALLFYQLVQDLIPYYLDLDSGLLSNGETLFPTVLFFNLWISFGVNVVLFTGAMSGINPAVVESAQIDGVNLLQEFWFISIPMIFPTIITFIVTGLAGIFTNQMHLYSLFGDNAGEGVSSFGYFLYVQTSHSDVISPSRSYISYSEISALGLVLTLIVFPITFGTRKLLEKFGPRTE
ncbi:MAG: sugar ABC transporter permease [Clostridia bacterium]|nr:sugar ABC transporter permease [Clostridia bacterium]MBQ8658963.1 sugar ABC transporter permease [Clostridia bacterium]